MNLKILEQNKKAWNDLVKSKKVYSNTVFPE